MSESPEIKNEAITLNKKYRGATLLSIDVNDKSRYYKKNPNPFLRLRSSFPLLVKRIKSKGKKIIFTLSSIRNECEDNIYIISSLGMDGKWQYFEGMHSGIVLNFGTSFRMNKRCIHSIEDILYYDDVKRFGILDVAVSKKELETRLKDVGKDFLSDEIELQEFHDKVRNKRIKTKSIASFLVEQRYFSGIGNIYKSEILYCACVKPDRTLESLSDDEVASIFDSTINILQQSFHEGGINSYTSPSGVSGAFEPQIYNKNTDSNGNKVVSLSITDNKKKITYWVPEIQS
jgi:formamidopyrimidine-DNA glycosylase